jgi:LmbE family N-acetylglucosaminyl deacetylase
MGVFVAQEDLAAGAILVLAPHADDEMIGCGGWLILTRDRLVKRVVVFCTKRESLRRAEAETACAGLDLAQVMDLDLLEGGLGGNDAIRVAAEKVNALIRTLSPTYIFVPALGDPHPDHRGTHALLRAALLGLDLVPASPTILQYEGLVPLGDANWWLDISNVVDEKWRRLRAYQSQDQRYGLVDMINYLNAYRGRTLLRRLITHAEAYKRLSKEEYLICTASLVSSSWVSMGRPTDC